MLLFLLLLSLLTLPKLGTIAFHFIFTESVMCHICIWESVKAGKHKQIVSFWSGTVIKVFSFYQFLSCSCQEQTLRSRHYFIWSIIYTTSPRRRPMVYKLSVEVREWFRLDRKCYYFLFLSCCCLGALRGISLQSITFGINSKVHSSICPFDRLRAINHTRSNVHCRKHSKYLNKKKKEHTHMVPKTH